MVNDDTLPEGAPMPEPVTLAAAADELRERLGARGITVPEQIDWDAADAQTRAEWDASRLRIRQQAWRDQVPEDFVAAQVGDFGDLDVEIKTPMGPTTTTVSAALRSWVPSHDRNIIIAGSTGVGKTRAAYAVGYALLDMGCAPYALTAPDVLDAFRPGHDSREQAWVLESDVLIIDDLGVDKTTDWADETWWSVINHRAAQRKPIVVTTNLTADDLREKYGNRIVSRLLANAPLILKMVGPDRRARF